jgi:hypothetical protein
MQRNELIETVRRSFLKERLQEIDSDFLSFEEEMILTEDLELICKLISAKQKLVNNPYNSILLYLTGVVDEFDKTRARSDTIGGSSPDCI